MSEDQNSPIYSPPSNVSLKSYFPDMASYQELYNKSIQDPYKFWDEQATKNIDWIKPFSEVLSGSLTTGDISWFDGGQLNVSAQCIDKHLKERADKAAIIMGG